MDPGNLPHNLFFQGSTRYQSVHINDLLLPDTMRSIHSLEKKKTKDNLLSKSKRNKKNATSLLKKDCKTVSKSVKKSVKRGVRVLRAQSARAPHSLSVFSLVPDLLFDFRAYLNTLKYGLFCSLPWKIPREKQIVSSEGATKEVHLKGCSWEFLHRLRS